MRPEDCILRMPAIRFCDRAMQDSHELNPIIIHFCSMKPIVPKLILLYVVLRRQQNSAAS